MSFESLYASIPKDKVDFTPLQKKIFTIKKFKITDVRVDRGVQFFRATVNDYIVKLRFKGEVIEGACSCIDFVLKKKKRNLFCKHILYLLDYIRSKTGSE